MRIEMWKITPVKMLFILLTLCLPFIACDKDDDNPVTERTFTVTIQNVSTATTLQAGAFPDRTAPLSPGIWAVIDGGTLFTLDAQADLGTERLAEEGSTAEKFVALNGQSWVEAQGTFMSTGGVDGPIIGAGETTTFTFKASPGDELQIMTMFGQSNDWFYSFFGGGLDLFDNAEDPINGDVTSELALYDAGTELDEMPGLGLTQKADHLATIDVGPIDPVDQVKIATSRHTTFIIPPTSSVIKVTISSTL